MKVSGSASARTSAVSTRAASGAKATGRFAASLSPSAGPGSTSQAGQVGALDGLLALQEVTDPSDERRRGVMRAEDLLDRLNDIRLGLLAGRIPVERLRLMVSTLRDRSAEIGDPGLRAIVDEIELRAAVELAKLGQMS